MTPELGILLGIIVVIIGGAYGLVRLGGRKADAGHAEDEVKQRATAQEKLDKYLAGRGAAGAWLRRKRMRDSSKD
jgi:hypothetical protein